MGKIEKALLEVVKNCENISNDNGLLNSYEQALDDFKTLINQGYTKSRGYNLQSIDENSGTMTFYTEI